MESEVAFDENARLYVQRALHFHEDRFDMHADVLSEIPIGIIQKQMTCLHGNLAFLSDKLKI